MTASQEKTILITGATEGIGKQTALELADLGHRVIIHGRNEKKAKFALQEIKKVTGSNSLTFCIGDFASLDEVSEMAQNIRERFDQIDVLINNAGVFMNKRKLSEDGFEMTFAVNHLAHFLLTGSLLDLLKKPGQARIINVASQAHGGRIDFENLQGEKQFGGYDAYSRSKLCNILFTNKLARELAGTNITVNSLHPGVIRTKLLRTGFGYGGSDVEHGSKTSVYLATSPDVADMSGKYFSHQRPSSPATIAFDISVQDKLWQVSEELTGYTYHI